MIQELHYLAVPDGRTSVIVPMTYCIIIDAKFNLFFEDENVWTNPIQNMGHFKMDAGIYSAETRKALKYYYFFTIFCRVCQFQVTVFKRAT